MSDSAQAILILTSTPNLSRLEGSDPCWKSIALRPEASDIDQIMFFDMAKSEVSHVAYLNAETPWVASKRGPTVYTPNIAFVDELADPITVNRQAICNMRHADVLPVAHIEGVIIEDVDLMLIGSATDCSCPEVVDGFILNRRDFGFIKALRYLEGTGSDVIALDEEFNTEGSVPGVALTELPSGWGEENEGLLYLLNSAFDESLGVHPDLAEILRGE